MSKVESCFWIAVFDRIFSIKQAKLRGPLANRLDRNRNTSYDNVYAEISICFVMFAV